MFLFVINLKPHKLKFEKRVINSVFIGYICNIKEYKLYDLENKLIFISRDVIFMKGFFHILQGKLQDTMSLQYLYLVNPKFLQIAYQTLIHN